jgi:hypothetical protein
VRADRHALRAALWAQLALLRARWGLRRRGVEGVVVPRPPEGLPRSAGRGVYAVLRRRPHTCLERALVLQAWESAHGNVRDVVIGVDPRGAEFTAHAWLAGELDGEDTRFWELMRLPAQ